MTNISMNLRTQMNKLLPTHIHDKNNGLDYTLHGDYYIPDLHFTPVDLSKYGRWGRVRYNFLRKHQPNLFWELVREDKLNAHLKDIDQQADTRITVMMEQLKKKHGITEAMKARDQMAWVGAMNTARHIAEETVLKELIYT